VSNPTEDAARRCAGQSIWQAANAFIDAVRVSTQSHPDMWPEDEKVTAIEGAVVAAMVAKRMGYLPGQTAPDSAPAP
jgi:hypothetical protein